MQRPAQRARLEGLKRKCHPVQEENEGNARLGQDFRMKTPAPRTGIGYEPGQQHRGRHAGQEPVKLQLHQAHQS